MNKTVSEGRWKQIRGEAKVWLGELTNDDLNRATGKIKVLAGLLQAKYGQSHEHAVAEINKHPAEAGLKKQAIPKPEQS